LILNAQHISSVKYLIGDACGQLSNPFFWHKNKTHRMISLDRAARKRTLVTNLNGISALDGVGHGIARLFFINGPAIARKDDGCTLCCQGGGSQARKPDARDDQALRDALKHRDV
jgi:hypothetical protein